MPTRQAAPRPLAPELETLAHAAEQRLRAALDEHGRDITETQQAVIQAASTAIAAGIALSAIAEAEQIGHARARHELASELLRRVERPAPPLRPVAQALEIRGHPLEPRVSDPRSSRRDHLGMPSRSDSNANPPSSKASTASAACTNAAAVRAIKGISAATRRSRSARRRLATVRSSHARRTNPRSPAVRATSVQARGTRQRRAGGTTPGRTRALSATRFRQRQQPALGGQRAVRERSWTSAAPRTGSQRPSAPAPRRAHAHAHAHAQPKQPQVPRRRARSCAQAAHAAPTRSRRGWRPASRSDPRHPYAPGCKSATRTSLASDARSRAIYTAATA